MGIFQSQTIVKLEQENIKLKKCIRDHELRYRLMLIDLENKQNLDVQCSDCAVGIKKPCKTIDGYYAINGILK